MADPVLTATLSGQRQILLEWTFALSAGFEIYWKSNVPADQEYVLLGSTNSLFYLTPDLEPTKVYDFYVKANVGVLFYYSNVVELFVSCGKGVILSPDPPPSPDPMFNTEYVVVSLGTGYPIGNQIGVMTAVYLNGFYWAFQPIQPASITVHIFKIDGFSGEMVATASVNTSPGSAGNLACATDGVRVFCIGGGSISSQVITVDPVSFPDAGSIILSDSVLPLGSGHSARSVVTPDGFMWFNYNGVRCINTVPNPSMASMETVSGTAGEGGPITYDAMNDYIFAAGGHGNPTKIWRINRASRTIIDFISVDTVTDCLVAFNSVWVPNDTQIRRYNPSTLALQLSLIQSCSFIGADRRNILIATSESKNQFAILDPHTNTIKQPGAWGSIMDPFGVNSSLVTSIQGDSSRYAFLAPAMGRPGATLFGWAFIKRLPIS